MFCWSRDYSGNNFIFECQYNGKLPLTPFFRFCTCRQSCVGDSQRKNNFFKDFSELILTSSDLIIISIELQLI